MNTRHNLSWVSNAAINRRALALSVVALMAQLLTACNFTGSVQPTANIQERVRPVPDAAIIKLMKQVEGKSVEQKKLALVEFHSNSQNNPSSRQKCAYALAKLLRKSGSEADIKEALPLFQEAEAVPELCGRASAYAADCAKFSGDIELARRELTNSINHDQEPLHKAMVEYSLAQSLFKDLQGTEARTYFEKIVKEAPDTQYAIGSKYYLGQICLNAGKQKEAFEFWRQYLKECPDGRYVRFILPFLKGLPDLTVQDHMLIADAHFYHGEPEKALLEWSKVGDKTQWLKQGRCLFRLGKPNLAKQTLLNGIMSRPDDPTVIDAAKLLCRPLAKEDALKIWQTVLAHCPAFADVALYNTGNRVPDDQKIKYYTELVNKYPDSEYAPESGWWVLWTKIQKGQTAAAIEDAKYGVEKFQKARSHPRFFFWLGKLYEHSKRQQDATATYNRLISLYPGDYYAYRAAGRLQAIAGATDPGWSTDVARSLKIYSAMNSGWNWPEPPELLPYEKIEDAYGPAASTLAQLRQWDECLEITPEKDPPCPEVRSIALAKLGRPLEAINTMSNDIKGTPGESLSWELAYPLLYSRIMSAEGAVKKVDPLLAQSLTRQESRYNVDAVSLSNARGLMQLLPPTAYGVAKRLKVPVSTVRDIHRPEINLKLGIDYLAYTLSRFGGNAMLAVASYNAGPNGVAGFTRKYSIADPDAFVEQIPYNETRDYVRKVFAGYWNYNAIYSRYLSPDSAGRAHFVANPADKVLRRRVNNECHISHLPLRIENRLEGGRN